MKTHIIKRHKFNNKTYKFDPPLKITTHTFICADNKTIKSELYVPSLPDGYTAEEFKNPEKEIKNFLNYNFQELIFKDDKELTTIDLLYKRKWLSFIS